MTYTSEEIYLSFETQERHHQKSKTGGISGSTKELMCSKIVEIIFPPVFFTIIQVLSVDVRMEAAVGCSEDYCDCPATHTGPKCESTTSKIFLHFK